MASNKYYDPPSGVNGLFIYSWSSEWVPQFPEDITEPITEIEVEQKLFKLDQLMIYLDYTKGSEDGLIITPYFKEDSIPDKSRRFRFSELNMSNEVVESQLVVKTEGTKRIPIALALNEDYGYIKFEFMGDDSNPGKVIAWMRPSSVSM